MAGGPTHGDIVTDTACHQFGILCIHVNRRELDSATSGQNLDGIVASHRPFAAGGKITKLHGRAVSPDLKELRSNRAGLALRQSVVCKADNIYSPRFQRVCKHDE